jgi:peptidoglycan hydrolase-like protein with peptidoglycan-binding domain
VTVSTYPPYDWSGRKFAAPAPFFLSKAGRIKGNWRSSAALTPHATGAVTTLAGQDSIYPASCTKGLPVYAGYYNGTFADLNAFRADFPSAVILSITPNGVKGARCIDCEPGDATVAEAAQFVKDNLPEAGAGGRNDGGKPMVYTSAGDAQAVINAVSGAGIARADWILWSAHWIGKHICSHAGCGYPDADGTQYASAAGFDSDLFYSYCFGTVSPWPLALGSTGSLVSILQSNVNKWVVALGGKFGASPLAVDGNFGVLTEAAVALAQLYFHNGGVSGTCDTALYADLEGSPLPPPPPPPPPPWAYQPVQALKLDGAGPHSVKFQFTAGAQPHPGLAKFQVVVSKGDKLTSDITGFPRYIDFSATGTYTQQYGDVEPTTGYTMGVRGMAQNGMHSSEWAILHFQTAA